MSERLTPEELQEWKRLWEAATEGEWKVRHRCVDCTEMDDEECGLGLEIEGPEEPALRGQFARSADARLIVEGHNRIIPALLAEVEWLQAECTRRAVLVAWVKQTIRPSQAIDYFGLQGPSEMLTGQYLEPSLMELAYEGRAAVEKAKEEGK